MSITALHCYFFCRQEGRIEEVKLSLTGDQIRSRQFDLGQDVPRKNHQGPGGLCLVSSVGEHKFGVEIVRAVAETIHRS